MKISVEIMRNILSKDRNIPISDTELQEKKIGVDLGLDEIDFCMISMEIEIICSISIPHTLFNTWINDLSTLTVKQIIDDCNMLIK